MKIIKRSGKEVPFDAGKIKTAIEKANKEVPNNNKLKKLEIEMIVCKISDKCEKMGRMCNVEEIQDMVENELMRLNAFEIARKYITYRYRHAVIRQANTTDEHILSLIECDNEEAKQENSNKNPTILSTQRDYMAGEVSRDIMERIILPEELVNAHKEGIIHIHDNDYISMRMTNCCLVNLEDMLQNGTVISGTMIEKPHRFQTACNIATQIVAQVASSQFGGQSITLSHLAPFVNESRQRIKKDVMGELKDSGIDIDEERVAKITEKRLLKEIKAGIQTIQYQLITLMTTNGQTPFVTIFMYINEVPEGQMRDDLVLIIKEMLKQRIHGIKNEKGVYITPAFPKLIYVLDENNIKEGTEHWELTKLAAKCTAKRMVPDYISAKKMKEMKEGNVYPSMGCVDGQEVITYKLHNQIFTESFERMWIRLQDYYKVEYQPNRKDLMIRTPGVKIYDQEQGFVDNYGVIRNHSNKWMRITFSNGRVLTCTPDHPFETVNNGIILAKDLQNTDEILIDRNHNIPIDNIYQINTDRAWLYGFTVCDSIYYNNYIASIAMTGEEEIEDAFVSILKNEFHLDTDIIDRHRGKKGNYKDLSAKANDNDDLNKLKLKFINLFEGKAKKDRHIPNEVFVWDENAKLAFLAGMIDADGHLNTSEKMAIIQIGSTNKELAIQQALLAQSLGMFAKIYVNHYRKNCKDKIRYRVEFTPTTDLLKYIKCEKKHNIKKSVLIRSNDSIATKNVTHIKNVEYFENDSYSYDVTTASEHFTVSGIYSHNCRSFLTYESDIKNPDGTPKFYGRLNQGVVTINLVDVACSSNGNMDKFWEILDERLELCHKALRIRHERLLGTKSDVAPILWQYGAFARLKSGETIDKLLYDGYSTISLGYAGLYEMCMRMTGKSHTDPEAKTFALAVMQKLNDKCKEWREKENIAYSVYGTPLESTTYKFAKCLQKRFGKIKNVTDHNYITNSYHINVREKIDAFTKLSFESEFQELSPGGAVSYVEVPNMQNNIEAVLAIMQHIYENIMYAELNTKSDYCQECGYDGEIQIVTDDSGKLVWECPNCGNRNQDKMNVARRTCGYIGTQFWNQGRTQEIRERVLHL